MSTHKLFGSFVIAAFFGASAFAAEPAAADAPATSEAKPMDSASVLAKARELRKRSDEGDAAATFDFWSLLVAVRTGGITLEPEHSAEVLKLGGYSTLSSWLFKSAEGGHQPAIDAICRLGEDRLAPARMRDQGAAQCEELRKKYPAP